MKKGKLGMRLILAIALIFAAQAGAFAQSVGFSVSAVIPSNQIDKNKTYLDLRMAPMQEQDLSLDVQNGSDEAIQVEVRLTFAQTNPNGLVIYDETDPALADPSLLYPLPSLTPNPVQVVEVEPRSTKRVSFPIQMPEEPFDGLLLGAFHAIKLPAEKEATEGGDTIMLKNMYAYVVGIQIRETDVVVEPDLQLTGIRADIHNYQPAIAANVCNPTASIIRDLHIETKVFKADGDELLCEATYDGFSMAPNCNVDIHTEWPKSQVPAGTYRLEMKAFNEVSEWSWDEVFEVTETE